ncbi:LysR family transcriptional regulator [Prauserella cavernicola]|uniref:LysR family transcriptional regulator n=1 Tax=Prauserella cavernicola TaxID=2800127 RepID=A0A934QVR9_9PSEU|nr:LysR family transcriptional regulator [Prauserella cavernicola]MBK1787440.1 LysR family transcriptional regulator [Prauserella cavernicola]
MELRHLRFALEIERHGHFGRAARALGMAQPPLSRHVAALEEELEVRLFDRTPQGVRVTAAGAVWLDHAREILRQVETATGAARRAARGQSGVLRLGFVGSALVALLPSLLARFRASHPGVVLEARELSSSDCAAALLAGEIDVAVCRGGPAGSGAERLVSIPICSDNLVVMCHRAHAFATRPAIEPDQLRGQPVVTVSDHDEPAVAAALAGVLDGRGGRAQVTRARDVHTIVGLVACDAGVGLLPASARSLARAETRVVEVDPPVRLPDMCLSFRRTDDSPALGAFLATTAAHCEGVGDRLTALGRA